jgi:hypothetical protein
VEVDEAEPLDDDSIHDVDLPAVVGLGIIEVVVWLELSWLLSMLPVLTQDPIDGLAVEVDPFLLQQVTDLAATASPAFPFEPENGFFHRWGCGEGVTPRSIAETLGSGFLVSSDPSLDLGAAEP